MSRLGKTQSAIILDHKTVEKTRVASGDRLADEFLVEEVNVALRRVHIRDEKGEYDLKLKKQGIR